MDSRNSGREPLDASGPREVVFCHGCEHDWYRDESGLICPNCDSDIIEIVSPSSDPRPPSLQPSNPGNSSEVRDFDTHYPWPSAGVPDPDEDDIDQHFPNLRERDHETNWTPRTAPGRQEAPGPEDPTHVFRDFQSMLSTLMGPNLQMGQPGRSGPEALYSGENGITRNTYITNGPHGTAQVTRITYRSPGLRPRDATSPQARGQSDELSLVLGNLFNAMGPLAAIQHNHDHEGGEHRAPQAFPLGGLFSQLFNPANAAAGDAVFTQEALDRVISDLMENHQTSNAPGPASPEAIARLPKKKLDSKMLGGDAKGECSVCMDDVHAGDEVVELPCHHWFHGTCVGAWLGEHNTCPICRKGLEGDSPSASSQRTSRTPSFSAANRVPGAFDAHNAHNAATLAAVRERQEARLNSIRERSGANYEPRYPAESSTRPARSPSPSAAQDSFTSSSFSGVGGYASAGRSSSFRRRDSGLSEGQSSSRSRRTGSEGGGGGGGVTGWLRDRFSGRRD